MAAAVNQLWPGTKFGIGPAIEDGFYYDFELPDGVALTLDELPIIEEKMRELVAADEPFVREEISKAEARVRFAGQDYKLQLIEKLPDDEVLSVYTTGDFVDLCRGPHVASTGYLKYFKLTKLAGAYWLGDKDNPMLQRIYGTAWQKASQLEAYLTRQAEAEKRDHRKLARELDFFSFNELAGSGLPLYHPKGARVLRLLQEWLRQLLYARGYVEAITPHIYKVDVWKTSGHYENYKDDMYFFDVFEDEGQDEGRRHLSEGKKEKVSEYAVKPMNCPGHIMIYDSTLHSYRDLPLRMFEFGTVYRHELSGVVHGLMRARGFTQDDAHIFCRADQVNTEVLLMLELVDYVMKVFGFEYSAELSTRPEKKYIGTIETWEFTTAALENALKERDIPYEINEGDGAFYGPKIDIKLRDAIGRTWQCSTIQFDALLPERFGLEYRTADNSVERPLMLHRTILGSMERFFGILIEHFSGALPSWLSPVQATVIPISDEMVDYANEVAAQLSEAEVRVEVDASNERMQAKIARAQAQHVPYMLIVGKREAESGVVAVRHRSEGDLGAETVDAFAARVLSERPAAR
jgi:threonyl-tRNA synthetase